MDSSNVENDVEGRSLAVADLANPLEDVREEEGEIDLLQINWPMQSAFSTLTDVAERLYRSNKLADHLSTGSSVQSKNFLRNACSATYDTVQHVIYALYAVQPACFLIDRLARSIGATIAPEHPKSTPQYTIQRIQKQIEKN